MAQVEFKVFFDGSAADRERLDRIESIEVEQEVDKAWEASLLIPVCLDEQGNWSGDDERFMEAFSRIRVEVNPGGNGFVPLIDGPIVGYDSNRSSEPGQSHIKLLVHDDGVHLNRQADVEALEGTDAEIARRVFGEYRDVISSSRVDDTPAASGRDGNRAVRRGTHMQLLRQLARRNDMHACVLPGSSPGASVGCFLPTPFEGGELPELVLLGRDRNIDTFNLQFNAQRPSTVRAASLSLEDKTVVERRSRYRNVELVGEAPPFESDDEVGSELLEPGAGDGADVQQRVDAETRRRSRAFDATGKLRGTCYAGVLEPYRRVVVRMGGTRGSASYVVQRVKHSLDRSHYLQDFGLESDSQSEAGGAGSLIPGGIF
jgi:hypothetical protein